MLARLLIVDKAVQGIEGGCEVTILCNQRGSIPVAGLVPATHVFGAEISGRLKTWVPGTSPGKGLLQENWGKTPA
jgi:hypothetical protein